MLPGQSSSPSSEILPISNFPQVTGDKSSISNTDSTLDIPIALRKGRVY